MFDESEPLVGEIGTMMFAPGALVPIFGVGGGAFFAVEIGVDGHAVFSLEFVDERVCFCPVAFGVVPEGEERSGKVGGRLGGRGGGGEFSSGHRNSKLD